MFGPKFLASVYLAVICASGAHAFALDSRKFSTHQVRQIGRGLTVESFHPVSTYETFGPDGVEHPHTKRADTSVEAAAIAVIEQKTGISADAIKFASSAPTENGHVAFIRQQHNGIKFANAVANVAFNSQNKLTAFGSSFVKTSTIASSTPKISQDQAISAAEGALGGKYNKKPVGLEYVAKSDKSAVLTHVVEVQDAETNAWFEAFVNAESGELVQVTDFVAQATFTVLPVFNEYPTQGFQTLVDPEDTTSSPYGWLSTDGVTQSTNTTGNNAFAYIVSTPANQTAPGEFTYNYTTGADPLTATQKNAAIVNAFYIVNTIHDISYKYGFTEATYNFQQTNIASGGKGNDRVKISVQDSSGTNNANFATPADGTSGQMRMFLWTLTNPRRDGAVENDIVSHEMTHGISNRMTGGGTGRCLQTTEAGGMGEGWSDTMANWLEKTSGDVNDFIMGEYVYTEGIRNYPYSTNASVNPLRYSSIASLNEVHNIGEVWANMLHNVYAALVGQYGWDAAARHDPTLATGNAVFLHLFIDSFLLQPCNPTFTSARDAWIQADANRYNGVNKCLLWKAFASRGLGVGAAGYKDSSVVPDDCAATPTSTSTTATSTSTSTTETSTSTTETSTTTTETSTSSTETPSSTSSTETSTSTTETSTSTTETSTSTTESTTSTTETSTTASPTSTPAPVCINPQCPADLLGAKGTLTVFNPGKYFQCQYPKGSCTYILPDGFLRNTAQSNCKTSVPCTT